MSAMYSTNMLC